MGIGKRIKQAREAKKLTQSELGMLVGVTGSAITNYEKEVSHPKEPVLYKLIEALSIDANFLFQDAVSPQPISITPAAHRIARAYDIAPEPTQRIVDVTLEPYMDKASSANAKLSEANTETSEPLIFASPNRTRLSLPLPMQSLSAGPGEYINGDYMAMAMVTLDISARKADYLMRVTGDSMEPDYPDGCIVAVEATSDIRHGEVGVFSVDGDHYLKKKGREGLMSINPKYPAIIINENNDVRCHGRVVGIAGDVEYIEE